MTKVNWFLKYVNNYRALFKQYVKSAAWVATFYDSVTISKEAKRKTFKRGRKSAVSKS